MLVPVTTTIYYWVGSSDPEEAANQKESTMRHEERKRKGKRSDVSEKYNTLKKRVSYETNTYVPVTGLLDSFPASECWAGLAGCSDET